MLENEINKYFGFLEKQYNFIKAPEYSFVREIHNDYIKGNIIIKIIYEGTYFVEIIKLKKDIKGLYNFEKKSVEIDKNLYTSFNLNELKRKKTYSLKDYSTILKENPEILNGNVVKFSLKYKILRFF